MDKAYAGDIIGVFDPGVFSIGDTICMPGKKFAFEGIPTFAPEHFARVRQVDTMKRKQFVKGINQIAQEGAIQIFQEFHTGMEEIIVGVVGVLQFEVLKYRLKNEYNVDIMPGEPALRAHPLDRERRDRSGQAGRHLRYEEGNGSQGQTAASLGKSLERGHDSRPEPGPEAHRIWPFLIMFPYFYLQNGQSLL